jgi:hypothetical protein
VCDDEVTSCAFTHPTSNLLVRPCVDGTERKTDNSRKATGEAASQGHSTANKLRGTKQYLQIASNAITSDHQGGVQLEAICPERR